MSKNRRAKGSDPERDIDQDPARPASNDPDMSSSGGPDGAGMSADGSVAGDASADGSAGGDALADGAAAGAPPESAEEFGAQLGALQSELGTLTDRHLRLAAEFDNYRKRIARERAELWARSQAELVKPLLDVLDDLQRVVHYENEAVSVEALAEGARLVEKKFRHALESAGLEPIDPQGEFFNPATMDALMTLPAEHPEEDEVVADVFQKGYRFGDLLIRPAKVRVKKYEESSPHAEA